VLAEVEETLSARILVEEHQAYTEAIRILLSGKWRLEGRRVVIEP
jgi:phosphoribosylglycinamide formyltransferase-1